MDRFTNHKIFLKRHPKGFVFYSFELQMAGVILLTAMAAGGISLWLKKRRAQKELENQQEDGAQN